MRWLRLLLWPAGAVLGIVGEWVLFGWSDPGDWLPDLVTGWSLIACGLLAWSRRPESRSGALLAATGLAWFAGNFQTTGFGTLDWLSEHALQLHRGPLVHLVLSYPHGRPTGRVERAAVLVGYAAAIVSSTWRSETATIVLSALLFLVAGRGYLVAAGRERAARLLALQAVFVLAAVLVGIASVRLAIPGGGADSATRLAYEVTLWALAGGLLAGLVRTNRAAVTDLVVELGETRSGTLRDALARALGDPTLEVGYWLPESGTYVDAAGRPLEVPTSGSNRSVTRIERDGQTLAALVHDPAVLDDPALVEAVAAAARLAVSHARLQAEVRTQLAELQASRRRLVRADDEERRRLEQRLHEGAERRLAALVQVVRHSRERVGASPATVAQIERAAGQLERTLTELHELAAGLHPRALTENGLAGALASLAEASPVPVELAVPGDRLRGDLEAAAYFVCSEALANVAKYASAAHVTVTVLAGDGLLRVEIADDGVGGAEPGRGTGLRGLVDRVDALGGTLRLESPVGSGTRLTAEIPLGGQPSPAEVIESR